MSITFSLLVGLEQFFGGKGMPEILTNKLEGSIV